MNETRSPEPGWYPYSDGTTRWWDGDNWGPASPQPGMPYTAFGAGVATRRPEPVKPHRGMAVTALVVGIIGALFGLIPILGYFAIILGVLGIVFGLLGHRHGIGKWGVGLSVLAVGLGIVGVVIVAHAFDHADKCLNSITVQDDGSVTQDKGC